MRFAVRVINLRFFDTTEAKNAGTPLKKFIRGTSHTMLMAELLMAIEDQLYDAPA